MSIPIDTIGASAGAGGALAVFFTKILPIILKKMNGNSKSNDNGKPGYTKTCVKNSNMLAGHEVLITQLCTNQDKFEKTTETARRENNAAHEKIFDKLDALK